MWPIPKNLDIAFGRSASRDFPYKLQLPNVRRRSARSLESGVVTCMRVSHRLSDNQEVFWNTD